MHPLPKWSKNIGQTLTNIIFQHPVSTIYQPKTKMIQFSLIQPRGEVSLQLSNQALILFSFMVGGISTDACETFAVSNRSTPPKNAEFQLRVDLTP